MKMCLGFFRKAVSLTLVLAIFVTFLAMTTGCPPSPVPEDAPPSDEAVQPDNGAESFAWETQRRVPRWRLGSRIPWVKSDTWEEAVTQSMSSGKPIFCYISRYDSVLTATLEDGLFAQDTWAPIISERFIPWELDWWEAPSLAQTFLAHHPAPAVFVMMPDENDVVVLDYWTGNDLLAWPLHDTLMPLDDPASIARIDEFTETMNGNFELETRAIVELPPDAEADIEADVEALFDSIHSKLLAGDDLWPEECLWLVYRLGHDEEVASRLNTVIDRWKERIDALGDGLVWMPDSIFVPDAGHAIDPERNMNAFLTASALGDNYPVNPFKLTGALKVMVTTQGGTFAGGFPAFLDIRSTLEGGTDYLDDDAALFGLDFIEGRLLSPTMGPRNVTWVNARMMASLLEIITSSPAIREMTADSGTKVSEFIIPVSKSMLDAIVANAGDIESLTLEEKIHVIDLMNRVYQLTASGDVLYMAEEIAVALLEDEIPEWDLGKMLPLYPDLAITLHNFGWLMELEEYKEAAEEIAQLGMMYADRYGYIEQVRCAYAFDVVHSRCVHTTVISAVDDEVGLELLMVGLEKWDPGKVSQIVTPDVDNELLERKGYSDMGTAAAFVCVDDMCKMPSFDVETLTATLEEVYTELHEPEEE